MVDFPFRLKRRSAAYMRWKPFTNMQRLFCWSNRLAAGWKSCPVQCTRDKAWTQDKHHCPWGHVMCYVCYVPTMFECVSECIQTRTFWSTHTGRGPSTQSNRWFGSSCKAWSAMQKPTKRWRQLQSVESSWICWIIFLEKLPDALTLLCLSGRCSLKQLRMCGATDNFNCVKRICCFVVTS